jgi:hypothetical protein
MEQNHGVMYKQILKNVLLKIKKVAILVMKNLIMLDNKPVIQVLHLQFNLEFR